MKTSTRMRFLLATCLAVLATQGACYNDLTGQPADRAYISSIDPSTVVAGGAAFTLTVNGYGFEAADLLSWQGTPKSATLVSSRQLTAQIPATDISNPGLVQVAVYRPGGSYDAVWLKVKSP